MFAAEIHSRRVDAMRACRHWRWHLDEVYAKVSGVTHYLWRAVDHKGEVLESVVTKTRDRKAALKFLRKAMKRHGRPETIVTASCGPMARLLRNSAAAMIARWDAGSTTELRTYTCRFDDANEPFCGSGACIPCRSSLQCMPRSTTTFRRSATSRTATFTSRPAPPLSPSGAASSLPVRKPGWGSRRLVRIGLTAPLPFLRGGMTAAAPRAAMAAWQARISSVSASTPRWT
jgi:DDE domain